MSDTQAIVIGAGPGGYPCAIRLGQLGIKDQNRQRIDKTNHHRTRHKSHLVTQLDPAPNQLQQSR